MTAQPTSTAKVGRSSQVSQKSARGGAKPGERRGGRQKGTPNKTTGELKDMILQALTNKGGVKYLESVAEEDMKAFCALIGRVLPLTVSGENGGPIEHKHVGKIEIHYIDAHSKG